MICKNVKDILSPYLDHVLSQEENIIIEKHLEKCPYCRQEFERLKKTIHILQSLPEQPLPENFSRELHQKLVVAQQESKVAQVKGWMKNSRFQWISLSTAAVLMLVIYSFLSPLLMKAGEQSDLPVPSTIQSEERADSAGTDNLEEAKPQLVQRKTAVVQDLEEEAEDTNMLNGTVNNSENETLNDMTNNESNNELNGEDSKMVSEGQRQDTVQADRGNNNTVETPMASVFSIQALSPETDINQPEEDTLSEKRSLSKEKSLFEEVPLSQDTVIELQIKNTQFEKYHDRIMELSGESPDVLEVAFENIDGEEKVSFTITVAKGAVSQVITEINTIDESLDQDMSDGEAAQDQIEYTSIKLIIREKK